MSRISIQIVTWNSLKFLSDCLSAIYSQTYFRNTSFPYRKQGSERSEGSYKDFSVIVVDNNSSDGTVEYLKKYHSSLCLIRNATNYGFSKAHNQAINLTSASYILVLNPDVILGPDWLKNAIETMESDGQIASLGGKLLKIRFGDLEIQEKIKTNIIDSAGLKIYKNRRIIARGEGEEDKGQYDKQEEIFGLSGACVLYRRLALEDIKIPTNYEKFTKIRKNDSQFVDSYDICRLASRWEYFDEDFFAYKEDVDLAWRLRLAGWKNVYLPGAKAYHFRAVSLSHRFTQSRWVNFLSYRNHLWVLLKNDYWQNFFCHLWFIFWYQLAKELYLLFTQPKILFGASFSFWQGFLKMLAKRRYIMENKKTSPKDIKRWLV